MTFARCYAHFGADSPPVRRAPIDIGGRLCAQVGIGNPHLAVSGQAKSGAWVTVSFNDDPDDTDVFHLVYPVDATPLGDTCSVECPLGRALNGARVGQTRRYETKSGRFMSITVLAVDGEDPKR